MAHVYGEPATGSAFDRLRRTGIGGSDTGPLLGLSRYKSRLGLWQEKRGLAPPVEPTDRMVWGTRLEHAVRRGYVADTGVPVTKPGATIRHPEYPWMLGHPDGLTPLGYQPEPRLLEVKCVSHMDGQWGPPGTEQVPLPYYSQVQHYLFITGFPVADLAALVGGREMRLYTIRAHADFQQALVADERDFWQLVVDGTPPPPDGSDDAGLALRRMYPEAMPESITATPQVAEYAERYLAARKAADEEAMRAQAFAQLMQGFMGARQRLDGPGWHATWANVKGRVDWQALALDLSTQALGDADLARKALDELGEAHRGEPSRQFRFTKDREL